jgi:hypothetical protein
VADSANPLAGYSKISDESLPWVPSNDVMQFVHNVGLSEFPECGSEGWGSNPIAIARRAILGLLVAVLQVGQRPGGPLVVAALDDRPSAGWT